MAAKFLYSIATIFGICFIGAALAFQLVYIKNNQNTDEYFPHQVASVVMDTIVVGYLLSFLMYYRPYNSPYQTGAITMLLIIGLGLEIFSTQWELNMAGTIGGYMLAASNALLRLFVFVQMRCDTPLSTIPDLIAEIAAVAETTGMTVADTVKAATVPLGSIDIDNAYRSTMRLLNETLNKVQLPQEEKDITRTKMRDVFGKGEHKPPQAVGGRRR
jgi:hypothetical protein